MDGLSVALVFFNPSLRTRASMQVGIFELGGHAVVLEPGGTSWTLEHRRGVTMDSDKTNTSLNSFASSGVLRAIGGELLRT